MNHISQPSQIEKLIAENIDLKAKLEKLQNETYSDFTVRITEIDGESCVCTADFRPNRINVAVDKNRVITRIIGIG